MIFNSNLDFHEVYGIVVLALIIRYLVIAGTAYFIFWVWKKDRFQKLRIQEKFPDSGKIFTELKYSMITFLIFGFIGTIIYYGNNYNYFNVYNSIADFGWAYYFFSLVAIILFHDTYFYWMHRAIHYQPVYKIVHKIHHISTNPTPWASFSFHPTEAVFEGLVFILFLLVLPLHYSALIFFLFFMTVMNVIGHLGYELYPAGFTTHWFWRWNNTSTHHNMHHKYFNCNYGLYFNFWDRVMGTNHPQYHQTFASVKSGRKTDN